jgi:tetratricopeptide (TPR) repeat protein
MPASVGLLERASSLLPDDAAEAPRLRSDLGYALFEIGEIRGADAALAQAEERARESGDRATELSAMVKRGNLSLYTDTASVDLDELERQTERAIEELAGLGEDSGLSRAWTALSEVLYLTGRLLAAGRATELAAEHARRVGSRREEAWAMGQYGFCLIEGPTPVPEAIARLERVLAEADENPVMAANLNGFLAVQEAMGGRIDDARARMAVGLSLTRDLGLRWQAGIHSLLGGYVEQLCGDPAAAERAMVEAQEVFREIDDRWFLSTVAVDLPRPVYQQGRFEDAWALVEAIDLWPAPSDLEWQLKRRGVRALLLARSGLIEEAALIAREAVLLGSESEFVHLRGWALRDLAEVYRIAGQISQASEAAASALRACESKGNLVGAAAARSLVAELGR